MYPHSTLAFTVSYWKPKEHNPQHLLGIIDVHLDVSGTSETK
jgi:hypothetical protein